jgi:hypothetical protein
MNVPSRSTSRSTSVQPREDWLRTGVLSGFLATFAMTIALLVAYGIATGIGSQTGNTLQRWSWALVHNPVAERTADGVMLAIGANLAVGLILALAYARFVEPPLDGPGWWKGLRFSLIPWLLSLAIFLPLMGGGFFGLDVGAGPLPIIGNLLLHLVYGAVLGTIYAEPAEDWLDDTQVDHEHAASAERGAAIGVAIGLPAGFVIGWLIAPGFENVAGRPETAFVGLAVGSFAGMGRSQPPTTGTAARH